VILPERRSNGYIIKDIPHIPHTKCEKPQPHTEDNTEAKSHAV